MYSSDYDDMGGFFVLVIFIVFGIFIALKHSEKKDRAIAKQQGTQLQLAQEQKLVNQKFERDFARDKLFDQNDFSLANRIIDYSRSGNIDLEKVSNVASVFGNMKKSIASEAARETANLIKSQMAQNRQNENSVQQVKQEPERIRYIEKPVYIERPRPINDNPHYYDPRNGWKYNTSHYE